MTTIEISKGIKKDLIKFFEENPYADKNFAFLFFLEKTHNLKPQIYKRSGLIYMNEDDLNVRIEEDKKTNELYVESSRKLTTSRKAIPSDAKLVYTCPFCGECFNGDAEGMSAIYAHVASCKKNNERQFGAKVKRFETSTDPKVITSLVSQNPEEKETQKLFITLKKGKGSEKISDKIFHTAKDAEKEALKGQIQEISATEILQQSKYELESEFVSFIEEQFQDNLINFVDALAQDSDFSHVAQRWEEEEAEEDEYEEE